MRTKALLTVAAALTAGLLTAQAQVYSVNIVGYVNVTLEEGNNLISNPLINGGNTLDEVLPAGSVPGDTTVSKWDFGSQGFAQADTYFEGAGWLDGDFNPSATTVAPGEGFFINIPEGSGQTVVTLVGDVVPEGEVTQPIQGPGFGMYANKIPAATGFNDNGFPVTINDATYQTFDAVGNSYSQADTYFEGAGWLDGDFNETNPTPGVGQGFLFFNPGAEAVWTQDFDPNPGE
jgi:hypothetical protein